MYALLHAGGTLGVSAYPVRIETHAENKLYGFSIVGLPDNAVRESRERVLSALRTSGFEVPARRYTINLAPADVRKEGTAFDLPIALGLLATTSQLNPRLLDDRLFLGELGLDGELRNVQGVLPVALEARNRGFRQIIVPASNASEAGLVQGIETIPVASLSDVVRWLESELAIDAFTVDPVDMLQSDSKGAGDLEDVRGQDAVKRVLEIAAAGAHNVLMIGPPGSGKTMLARRLPSILPPMSFEEAVETTKVHSVAGLLSPDEPFIRERPFRAPHHTISDAALVGGGTGVPRPGEISLAHHGVLFLDELPEFARNALEVLRQPMESRSITISRSRFSLTYPARFQLVASMNPCPCGHYGAPEQECTCTPVARDRYMGKISGPLLDRIDLQVRVSQVRWQEISAGCGGESSASVRKRVLKARERQKQRAGEEGNGVNAELGPVETRSYCRPDQAAMNVLRDAMNRLGLSGRAYDKILKVSRTIADLAEADEIRAEHIAEAVQYRSLDRPAVPA